MIKVNVKIGAGENVLVGSESNLDPKTVDAISEGDFPDVVVVHIGEIRLEVVETSIQSLAMKIADALGCVVEFNEQDKMYRFIESGGPKGLEGDPGPSEPEPEVNGGEKISLEEIAELERLADGQGGTLPPE